jgi:hypothetical protein
MSYINLKKMSWINLKLDVQVKTNKGEYDLIQAIRRGVVRGLDEKGVAAPLDVKVSVDFRDKEQLYYMITDLGKRAEVTLFYEESGNLKPAGHEFHVHSYMLGTDQGCGYIKYEIQCLLEETNEQGIYHDSLAQVYETFLDLPASVQEEVERVVEDGMSSDGKLLALSKIGLDAAVSLDGSVGLFRFKNK